MVAVNPDILIWARETAALDMEEAARKLGFASSGRSTAAEKLQQLEDGTKNPTQSQLEKMANVYRQPVVAFYLNLEPRKGDRGVDFRTVPQQKNDPLGNARLDILISSVKARQSLTRDLVEDQDGDSLPFVGSADDSMDAEFIANEITKTIGFDLKKFRRRPSQPSDAFNYLRKRAESAGIYVLAMSDLGHPQTNTIPVSVFRGFALVDELAPYIVVNRKDSKRAQCFTLLHEIAHIWLGSSGISGRIFDANYTLEILCSRIAGRILLPRREVSELSSMLYKSIEDIRPIIRQFANARNLSQPMVAYNLKLEGFLSLESWQRIQNRYDLDQQNREQQEREKRERDKALGKSTPINPNRLKRFSLGEPLLDLARLSLANGELTPTKASTLLGVNPRKVRAFLYPDRRERAV